VSAFNRRDILIRRAYEHARVYLHLGQRKGSNPTIQPLMPRLPPYCWSGSRISSKQPGEFPFPLGRPSARCTAHQPCSLLPTVSPLIASRLASPPISHCLKHAFATHVIHTIGILHTRQYLGHVSICSTPAIFSQQRRQGIAGDPGGLSAGGCHNLLESPAVLNINKGDSITAEEFKSVDTCALVADLKRRMSEIEQARQELGFGSSNVSVPARGRLRGQNCEHRQESEHERRRY